MKYVFFNSEVFYLKKWAPTKEMLVMMTMIINHNKNVTLNNLHCEI